MSKKLKSRLKRAALAGIAMYGASKMLGAQKIVPTGALPGAKTCLLYTSPSPRDRQKSRMPSSA